MKRLWFVSLALFAVAAAPSARQAGQPPAATMAPTLKVGDKAPDFSLPGTDGKVHSLANYKGKYVVLAWFPKAMTTGCTQECKSITENSEALKGFDVAYFMVSVDTPELNKQFAERDSANFPLLSDPDKKVATAYGVLNQGGLANRWTFYIGPDGKLVKVDADASKHTLTAGPDLIASLNELKVPKRRM
jgi:thioredoxin-dependent peroxiredoxin